MNFSEEKVLYLQPFDEDFLIYSNFLLTKVPSRIVKAFTGMIFWNYCIAAVTVALYFNWIVTTILCSGAIFC